MKILWHRVCTSLRRIALSLAVCLIAFSASSGIALAVQCAPGISGLDCAAIYNSWIDWVPNACDAGATSDTTTLGGKDTTMKIFSYFTGKGYTPSQVAGIIGNMMVESGLIPTRIQDGFMPPNIKTISYSKLPDYILNDPHVGWGIVQWTPVTKIGTYAHTVNEDPDKLETQLEFLWKQLEGTAPNSSEKPAGDALKATKDYKDAASAFLDYYERPLDPAATVLTRQHNARDALAEYNREIGAGGGTTTDPTTPTTSTCGNTETIATKCPTSPPGGGYGPVQRALKTQFHINLIGDANTDWAIQTYESICALSSAPVYFSKLIANGQPIAINLHNGGCSSGHADSFIGVDLYGFCDKNYNRYILDHELGHMYSFRNYQAYQNFYNNVYLKYPQIPTWDCTIHNFVNGAPVGYGGGPIPEECWAAMIGEYSIYFNLRETVAGAPAGNADFKEYPTKYPKYYQFARDKLFGGVEFKSF